MGSFLRATITEDTTLRGSGRLLYAPITQAAPVKISDVIALAAGATQYDPVVGWSELGATKTGIQVTRNNAEDTFDVDQINGDIDAAPTSWEMMIATAIAEMTPENLTLAWETGVITTAVLAPAPNEKHMPLGNPTSYVIRRMAVVHQRANGKIRMFAFRKVQHMPQESTVNMQKQGEQQTVACRFKCLADSSVADPNARFGEIIDQV